jgi:hypothetical protein
MRAVIVVSVAWVGTSCGVQTIQAATLQLEQPQLVQHAPRQHGRPLWHDPKAFVYMGDNMDYSDTFLNDGGGSMPQLLSSKIKPPS